MKYIFTGIVILLFLPAMAQLTPKQDTGTQLWGYANAAGSWVIQPKYKTADSFNSGIARVQLNELYGMINETGSAVVPIIYKYIGYNTDGLINATSTDGYHGFLDTRGNIVVPFKYNDVIGFSSGLSAAKLNGKWGFIDKTGKVVIDFIYDTQLVDDDWFFGESYDMGYNFQGNYAVVAKNSLYGIIDKTGKVIVDFKYASLMIYTDTNLALAETCDPGYVNCKFGLINLQGNTILPFEYSAIQQSGDVFKIFQGSEFDDYFGDITGGMMGFADKNGKLISPCMYDNDETYVYENLAYAFSNQRFKGSGLNDGMILVRKNNRWGYLDASGKEVIPFQFEEATTFASDSAEVTLNGNKFFINKQGRCIKNCPDDMPLLTLEKVADQTANYNTIINVFMKFYIDDASLYAGEEKDKRRKKLYDENEYILDQVITHGTAQQQKLARHLKLVVVKEIGFNMSRVSCEQALPMLRKVRSIATQINPADYPVTFEYNGAGREYTQETFNNLYKSYFSTLAECEYLTRDPLATEDLKKAIALENSNFNIALFNSYLVDHKQNIRQYDKELLDYSSSLLEKYILLTPGERIKLDSLKLWSGNQPAAVEAAFSANNSEKIPSAFYMKNYPLYKQLGDDANASYFMEKVYQSGYDDTNFLWEMAETMKTKNPGEATKIADKLSIKTSITDCYNLQRLAELYLSLGNNTAAKDMKEKADNCTKSEQKQSEKREKENKKENKRSYSSYGVRPGIYFGFDVFPALSTVKGHRDYGFCMDIVTRKMAHEFYYEIINENRDHMFDVGMNGGDTDGYDIRWNGYQAAYAFKAFTEDDNTAPYVGLCARYRNKTFNPVKSTIMDENNNLLVGEKEYSPTETQYELLLNYGFMTTKRGFACDMYFGFGPKYSVFKKNVSDEPEGGIYSNALMESRNESRWGLGVRIGITIGLKL